jgi:hypothetical protein
MTIRVYGGHVGAAGAAVAAAAAVRARRRRMMETSSRAMPAPVSSPPIPNRAEHRPQDRSRDASADRHLGGERPLRSAGAEREGAGPRGVTVAGAEPASPKLYVSEPPLVSIASGRSVPCP